MEIRVQKWLADAGVASRRAAEKIILDGRVSVNGKTVSVLGEKADTKLDEIRVDGKEIKYKTENIYVMLHKPEGVMTTLHDPEGRVTILDYLTEIRERIYPVGRLDYDSSGLLLLTNDGDWANNIVHPRFGVKKKYAAWVYGIPTQEELRIFKSGINMDGKRTAKCDIKIVKTDKGDGQNGRSPVKSLVHVILTEGRNRQVRKMCEAIGHPILSLKRIAIGQLKLGELEKGAWRFLTEDEVRGLYN